MALPISLLMTTYAGERAEFLRQSLASLVVQTQPARQHVLVVDGPIDKAQERVIEEFAPQLSLQLIRLKQNLGLAGALNAGLEVCEQPWCARMDSDDICEPTRLEEQWRAVQADPALDLVASWTAEFDSDTGKILAYKTGPLEHRDILRTLYWRCVVHHPTVLMRISKVRDAGGYSSDFRLMEDYDLFLRMAAVGSRMTILPKPLLRFRTSEAQRRRRGGLRYLGVEMRFRFHCAIRGLTPVWIAASSFALTAPFRLMPAPCKALAYRLVRNKPSELHRGPAME